MRAINNTFSNRTIYLQDFYIILDTCHSFLNNFQHSALARRRQSITHAFNINLK
jgi:hypothetical protein